RLRFLRDTQGCPALCARALSPGHRLTEPRLVYFIYSLLMGLAALLLAPYWLVKGLRHGKYLSNLKERLGFSFPSLPRLPPEHAGAIWIHPVSAGEVLSGVTLARQLKSDYPERPLSLSTTTSTGQALARDRSRCADAGVRIPDAGRKGRRTDSRAGAARRARHGQR